MENAVAVKFRVLWDVAQLRRVLGTINNLLNILYFEWAVIDLDSESIEIYKSGEGTKP